MTKAKVDGSPNVGDFMNSCHHHKAFTVNHLPILPHQILHHAKSSTTTLDTSLLTTSYNTVALPIRSLVRHILKEL